MAVYREMDIGTAKPTPDQQAEIPHHLINCIGPEEPFSLARYIEMVEQLVDQISERGNHILFVGGTPLYLKGLLRGIFEGPPSDPDYRAEIVRLSEKESPDWLHSQLAKCDPAAAERLHANDTKRLVRALEVFEKTGRPISDWQNEFDHATPAEECRVFAMQWDREKLYDRINRRVDMMFKSGLVDEVRRLLDRDPPIGPTASEGIGYREVITHLSGQSSLEETIELVKRNSRRLAKRQNTWFRSLSECRSVAVDDPLNPVEIAEQIAAKGLRSG